MFVTYTGPGDSRTLWGVDFPKGAAVEVTSPALASKCRALGCFDFGLSEPQPAPTLEPEPESEPKPAKKKRGRPRKKKTS